MSVLNLLALALKGRPPGPVDLGGTPMRWDGERVVRRCTHVETDDDGNATGAQCTLDVGHVGGHYY